MPIPYRRIVAAIRDELDRDPKSAACLLPSTEDTFQSAQELTRRDPGLAVVGPSLAGALEPIALLQQLRSGRKPTGLLIFSDQLLDPAVATLLVEREQGPEYFSGLEAVIHANYGYRLSALIDEQVMRAEVPASTIGTLRLLDRYLDACLTLGDRWIMRDAQCARQPAERLATARLRLRYFHSAVFHIYATRRVDQAGREAMARLNGADRQLAVVARSC